MAKTNFNNDKEIVVAIKNGNQKAFQLLFDNYYKGLVGYITTYSQDSNVSEDIVQHSFVTLWNKRADLLPNTSPKSYLYTIAYNKYIDEYRKKVRENQLIKELTLENLRVNIKEDKEVLEKRIDQLHKIIEKLPPRCKEVLFLSKQRGLNYTEIGKKLKISPRTVEEQIRIAFKKIRKEFKNNTFMFFLFGIKSH